MDGDDIEDDLEQEMHNFGTLCSNLATRLFNPVGALSSKQVNRRSRVWDYRVSLRNFLVLEGVIVKPSNRRWATSRKMVGELFTVSWQRLGMSGVLFCVAQA